MIGGTMGVVVLFIESRSSLLADLIIPNSNVKWAIVALSLFSGLISAFVDNVATVLMVAPAASRFQKLNISPVPSVIAIAVASNPQGAYLGRRYNINTPGRLCQHGFRFLLLSRRLGLFWVVQLGAVAASLDTALHPQKPQPAHQQY